MILRSYDLSEEASDGFFATAINAPDDDCECDDMNGKNQGISSCPSVILVQRTPDAISLTDSSDVSVGALSECSDGVKEFEKILVNTAGYPFEVKDVEFTIDSGSLHPDAIFVQDCGADCVFDEGTGMYWYQRTIRFTIATELLPLGSFTITALITIEQCGAFNPTTFTCEFDAVTFDIIP